MTLQNKESLPIGLFDSGVGGLTVLSELVKVLPHEDFLYLGDTARVPYGTKDAETIITYALEATTALLERKIKMLVVACNTATVALSVLQERFPKLPIIGVIESAATQAVAVSKNKHVLILGTKATVNNKKYHERINTLAPDFTVSGVPCSLLVSLAEEGWFAQNPIDPVRGRNIAKIVVAEYLSTIYPLTADELYVEIDTTLPDSVILGCTHFPPFISIIAHMLGPHVQIIDPAVCMTHSVVQTLEEKNLQNKQKKQGQLQFLVTTEKASFARVGSMLLGLPISVASVEEIQLP